MKLEDFAKKAGCIVSLTPEDERWEGKWQCKSVPVRKKFYLAVEVW